MRLPRDISGQDLIKALRFFGYVVTRQKGTHVRVSTTRDGEHHETIPVHTPIKIGTLSSILKSVAAHHGVTVEQVLAELDLWPRRLLPVDPPMNRPEARNSIV